MAKVRILVVDDEPGMLEVYADTLRRIANVEVVIESASPRAVERLARERFDLLIADVRMPQVDGVQLLKTARERDADLAALMITAFPSVETAVESMKLGAADYLTKPFLPDDLLRTVTRLLEAQQLREENRLLLRQVERPYVFSDMIGKTAAMQAVFRAIEGAAGSDADVLVLGETGTGKELVARAIHRGSRRKSGRFVPVDSGAIPEDLLENEFFGHEREAFTGAVTRSLGLLEFANGGTFFLDEIGELPLRLQAKLLRVLQERKIRRVGGTEELGVDVRVIAATSRTLEEEIAARRFRMDLYYRINVVRIELPPLRARAEDIPLLVSHFVARYAAEMGRQDVRVDDDALEMLRNYSWPGNVRELQNVVRRALALARREMISVEDLPEEIASGIPVQPGAATEGFFALRGEHVAAFEKEYLGQLLRSFQGDISQAAREAKLPRGTLYRLLKKYGLNPADFRG